VTSAEPLLVTFLGTRDAAVRPGTFTSSQLVTLGDTDVLVDAGLGSAAQLARAGLGPDELEAIVLTHWHPDHVAGLPNLLRRGWSGGTVPKVFAPPPPATAGLWRRLKAHGMARILARLDVIEVGETIELGALRLEAFATAHGTPSRGWRFSEADGGDRVVVIPGDSRPTTEIAERAAGADLLVFEATFLDRDRERAMQSSHATAYEAGVLAREAGVGALALTHLSARYPRAEVAAEAQLAFDTVLVPCDLDRAAVSPRDGSVHGVVTLGPIERSA
jgi:ribonuclease Z